MANDETEPEPHTFAGEGPRAVESEDEIRIGEHAITSAVARSIGIEAGEKAYPLLLAETRERSQPVHDALVAFLAAYRTWIRRRRQLEDAVPEGTADQRAKLDESVLRRDVQAEALRRAIATHRASMALAPPLTRTLADVLFDPQDVAAELRPKSGD